MYKWKDGFESDICDKDKQCRYMLGKKGKNTLICIGANPSIASGSECDATMNLLCAILENNGYDGFIMLNLYPLIATNPDDLPQVNHKDMNKKNNSVENLEWITNRDNCIHYHQNKYKR